MASYLNTKPPYLTLERSAMPDGISYYIAARWPDQSAPAKCRFQIGPGPEESLLTDDLDAIVKWVKDQHTGSDAEATITEAIR